MDLLNSSYQPPWMVYNHDVYFSFSMPIQIFISCLLCFMLSFISLQLIITWFLLTKHVFLCFNRLCHDYLFVRTCFSIYQVSIVKIVIYDYCGDVSLQIGDKFGFGWDSFFIWILFPNSHALVAHWLL